MGEQPRRGCQTEATGRAFVNVSRAGFRVMIAVSALLLPRHVSFGSQNAPTPAPTQPLAICVGLSEFLYNPTLAPDSYADRDALHFSDHLKSERGGSLSQPGLQILVNKDANQNALRDKIQKALSQVRRGGEVYLFISGRGKSVANYREGYIYAYDSVEEKGSSAIRVSDLQDWIRNSPASRVFIFADLTRAFDAQPVSALPASPNLINDRLQELGKIKISGKSIDGILASEKGPAYQVAASARLNNFAYYLFEGLQHPSPLQKDPQVVDLNRLMAYLRGKLASKPVVFGNDKAAGSFLLSDLKKKPALEANAGFARWNSLLAFLGGPLSVAWEHAEDDPFETAMSGGRLIGPGSASDVAASFAPGDERLNRLSLALENRAQQVITRYGTGDQFPISEERKDLLEEKKADFVDAGALFDAAAAVQRRMGAPPGTLKSLESKSGFCVGRARMFDGDLTGARTILTQSDIVESQNALGIVALRQSSYTDAKKWFEAAISAEPDWAFPRHNLALTLEQMGDYKGAEAQYREAIQRTPYYPYLYYNLALLQQRLNRKSGAKKEYLLALACFKEQERRYTQAAAHWAALGQGKEQNQSLARVQELAANEAEVHNALGLLLRSLDEFGQALTLNPKLLAVHHNRAMLLLSMGREQEAIKEWTVNDFTPSHRELGALYLRRGDFAAAAEQLRLVVKAYPNSVESRLQLARALVGSDPADALTTLNEIATENLWRPDVRKAMGDAYRGLGNTDQACKEYALATTARKTSVFADDNQESKDLKTKSNTCPAAAK
jgi:tetratricopeptide (TPR) repeat protein